MILLLFIIDTCRLLKLRNLSMLEIELYVGVVNISEDPAKLKKR